MDTHNSSYHLYILFAVFQFRIGSYYLCEAPAAKYWVGLRFVVELGVP